MTYKVGTVGTEIWESEHGEFKQASEAIGCGFQPNTICVKTVCQSISKEVIFEMEVTFDQKDVEKMLDLLK